MPARFVTTPNGADIEAGPPLLLYGKIRSGAVHGEDVPGVSTKMARDVEWAVRDTLNQCLTLSRQHRLSRRGRLLRLLDQHPDRPQLIAWLREHGGPDWTDHLDKINAEADAAAVGAPN